ncbi:uncharacterized protein LOC121972365 [Zingiber officinale]|uniref:uncharacterized protein LOC121972365 n=1 Tax=Zingiber officinale TaxID=94328 RepID=UPI001C4D0F75|nr:uncharacterized protein LOC121972365 [Zingiber officinale]
MTDNFVQPAIPKFDGYYDHWSMLMENFLCSKEYWSLVETGIPVAVEGVELTEAQGKLFADQKLKDLKVKNYLFQVIDRTIMETILNKDTSKHIWDSMKQKYQGSTRVKRAQLQTLRKEFEILHMQEGESVDSYFARTLTIANKMKIHGENMQQVSNNLDILSLDELQSSLLVHEQRMNRHGSDEQALKVTYDKIGEDAGRGRGHFQYECPKWEKEVNYAELEEKEELLLMSYIKLDQAMREDVWFLDSGCSNHMCAHKEWFSDLDEEFRTSVKLGNNSTMTVMGKGNIRLQIIRATQIWASKFQGFESVAIQENGERVATTEGIIQNLH